MPEPLPAETGLLWEEFHRYINMTSEELRTWLLTEASGTEAFPAEPRLGVPELGERVVSVLRKRKTDLTSGDTDTMRQAVSYIEDRLAEQPPAGPADDRWRHCLMTAGHDPLKPGASTTGE